VNVQPTIIPVADALPGLEPPERTETDLVAEAHDIIAAAQAKHKPTKTFILYSGGNDSAVVLDVCSSFADEVVFINTGIAIPDAVTHARTTGTRTGLPFREMSPPESYESLVLGRWDGLPGPGAHRYTYQRLKERCVAQLLREHRSYTGERFMLLTGVRRAESKRRMGYTDPVNRNGGQVWVNPLLNWSNEAMRRYRTDHALPVNPVSANLHMSGECMCGAMASQGEGREEREAIRFFYPEFDDYLTDLETRAQQAGCRYTEWGVKRADGARIDIEVDGQMSLGDVDPEWSPLCQSCEFRADRRQP
jgi:3'-phosphoadenosine 5'-phosphosulfate sulfotransferase (PAPS reductase)/FAD synthetase